MVGPASPRVISSEGVAQEDHRGERHHLQALARGNSHSNWHPRQPNLKQYPVGQYGRRNGQRNEGADFKAEWPPDVNGRNLPSSSASSSGRSYYPSCNLDRFLEVTTPRVKTQNLRKSSMHGSSQKRCFNPEEAPFFNIGDLWDSFDEWSAYGAGVPLVLNGGESVVQYYVPYLSAIELYTVPSQRPNFYRNRGSEGTSSERSFRNGKGSKSPSMKSGSPLGSKPRLECRPFTNDDDEELKVWYYFETNSPHSRVPLVDKIADLSRNYRMPENDPLRSLRSLDLMPNSFFSVAWYPIYRIPTGPTIRDLDACFLTFHPLSKPWQSEGDIPLRLPCHKDVCFMPSVAPSELLSLHAFGLASYKLRGSFWSSYSERRQKLLKAAYDRLNQNGVQHPDFNYFTSHGSPCRR